MNAPQTNLFGKLAVALGFITEAQLAECVDVQAEHLRKGREYMRIGEILELKGYLDADTKNRLLAINLKKPKTLFGETAVQLQHCQPEDIEQALTEQAERRAKGKQLRIGEVLVKLGKLQEHQIPILLQYQHSVRQYESESGIVPALPDAPVRPEPLSTGAVFSGYTIQDVLGEDDFGYTYLVSDKGKDRPAALRVLSPTTCKHPNLISTIKDNLMTLKNLRNKHVRRVYRLSQTEEQTVSIALAYIDGVSIYRKIREGAKLPWETAVKYILQTAEGLAAALEAGIIHEDLRPSQLIVDASDNIVINNLGMRAGIKTELFKFSVEESKTPCYLAPESVIQDGVIDHRSDIFSLGMTLYFLVTGEHMLKGTTPMEALLKLSFGEIAKIGDAVRNCPAELDDIVQKMCQPEPEQRYQAYPELIDELRRVQKGIAKSQILQDNTPLLPSVAEQNSNTASSFPPLEDPQVFGAADELENYEETESHSTEESEYDEEESIEEEERIRVAKSPLQALKAFWQNSFGGFFNFSFDTQGCLIPTLFLLLLGLGAFKGYPHVKRWLSDYDITETGEIEFNEPAGSFQQRVAFYETILRDDSLTIKRKSAASVKKQAILKEMSQSAASRMATIQGNIDLHVDKGNFQAALQQIENFSSKTYFTTEWKETKQALLDDTQTRIDEHLQTLQATVSTLIASESFDSAKTRIQFYRQTDYQPMIDLTNTLSENLRVAQAAASAAADQQHLMTSKQIWETARDEQILPLISTLQFEEARRTLDTLKSNQNGQLAAEHILQIKTLQSDLHDTTLRYKDLCKASKSLCKDLPFHYRQGNATLRLIEMKMLEWIFVEKGSESNKRKIEPKRISPADRYRLLARVTAEHDNEDTLLHMTKLSLSAQQPLWSGYLYQHLLQLSSSQPEIEAELHRQSATWLQKLQSAPSMRQWLQLKYVHAEAQLFEDKQRQQAADSWRQQLISMSGQGKRAPDTAADFSDKEQLQLFRTLIGGPTWNQESMLFESGSNAVWNKDDDLETVLLLFRMPTEHGTLDIEFGNAVFSFDCKSDELRLRSRIGAEWKAVEDIHPDDQWHIIVLHHDKNFTLITFDGRIIQQTRSTHRGKVEFRMSISGKSPVMMDDILVWNKR